MKIEKWQPDKWKHFYTGIPLGILLQLTADYYSEQLPFQSYFASFVVLAAICYGFELLSLITRKGHYDLMDAIAGIAGGLIGILLVTLITFMIN